MKISMRGLCVLMAALCGILLSDNLSAQTYHRYIKPEDLGSKALYADSIMTAITLPRGVASVINNPKFNIAAMEIAYVMNDPEKEVMQVYVCGSASPDGLWGDNVKLSQARTDAAAEYLASVLDIPSYKIYRQSLNEDWDRLYEMVAESDMEYKYNVMTIIKSMDWGERKRALQQLDGGKAWKILEKDFFPKLRCVRIAVFCKWNPSKPYMTEPVNESMRSLKESESYPYVKDVRPDTVYIRDTVYYIKETIRIPEGDTTVASVDSAYEEYRTASINSMNKSHRERKVYDTPWMMGIKTNLLADAMAIPSLGMEFQISDRLSLDLQGWYTNFNIFVPSDKSANVYGFSPEIRWWTGKSAMKKGSFFGLHARMAWYTMQWTDGYLYQNGDEMEYAGKAGNSTPAWSIGLTYGYSFSLDKRNRWGLEFLLGVGYGNYKTNIGEWSEKDSNWYIKTHQNNTHIGITRASVNLTYRFSVRKVNPDYYKR